MIQKKSSNELITIENGRLKIYHLDNKRIWSIGRPSSTNMPDISFMSPTISRKHAELGYSDGAWIFTDWNGKNGTVYNGEHLSLIHNKYIDPKVLSHGDVMILGGGNEAVIDSKTVWTMFMEWNYSDDWITMDTAGMDAITVTSATESIQVEHPHKGQVIELSNGIAIYMGDVTYLSGDIAVE